MTILLLNFSKTKMEKIPAVLIGLVLDSATLYGLYDVLNAYLN